jgi:cytosine permease
MSNPTGPTASPPAPEAVAPAPPAPAAVLERSPWLTGSAPKYIGLFLWVVYFDQLPRATLASGGLLPSVLGALVAGLLCHVLLYTPPALWGFKTGRPLTTLGTSTFGVKGAPWLTGVLIGLGQVVWFAVATWYAAELTLEGLVCCRLLHPRWLEPMRLGGLQFPNAIFLVTSLAWSFAAALVGHYLLQIISALMNFYPIFMAVLLAAAVGFTLADVSRFRQPEWDVPVEAAALRAFTMMIELVFGFFAMAGALSADWGAVSRTERDVQLNGWVAVVFASWTVATLALLTVAGAQHRAAMVGGLAMTDPVLNLGYTFRGAVLAGIGGTLGTAILLVFGLGSLAPTCYAAYLFGHRFEAAWPRLSRIRWTLIGTTVAWLVIASGRAARVATVFSLMGAVFAPLVAALAADSLGQRGAWPVPRRGVNLPGLIAWAAGLAVGLVPIVSHAVGWQTGTRFQPAALYAYLVAFVTYIVLAKFGAEASPVRITSGEPGTGVVLEGT